MRAYSIFDDFDGEAATMLSRAGVELTIHPLGLPRPNDTRMKEILEEYDCAIIGTSQKLNPEMFEHVEGRRIIATASIGTDHIRFPKEQGDKIHVINAPRANARAVAEYTMGMALCFNRMFFEGSMLYRMKKDNKSLQHKPKELFGKTLGLIGAGNTVKEIVRLAHCFEMNLVCWTRNPMAHADLEREGVRFLEKAELARTSDIVSVNLPSLAETRGLITADFLDNMKTDATLISVSRIDVIDFDSVIEKLRACPNFHVALDIDMEFRVVEKIRDISNIIVTPHIAGGTVEARKRMFRELATRICMYMEDDALK